MFHIFIDSNVKRSKRFTGFTDMLYSAFGTECSTNYTSIAYVNVNILWWLEERCTYKVWKIPYGSSVNLNGHSHLKTKVPPD